jgi:hypothetical protein
VVTADPGQEKPTLDQRLAAAEADIGYRGNAGSPVDQFLKIVGIDTIPCCWMRMIAAVPASDVALGRQQDPENRGSRTMNAINASHADLTASSMQNMQIKRGSIQNVGCTGIHTALIRYPGHDISTLNSVDAQPKPSAMPCPWVLVLSD